MIRKALWSVLCASALSANDGKVVTHSEFSYINTKGNTDTTSLAFEGNAKTSVGVHVFRAHVDAYRSSDSGQTSKDKWSSELNYDYRLCPRVSLNYLAGYKQPFQRVRLPALPDPVSPLDECAYPRFAGERPHGRTSPKPPRRRLFSSKQGDLPLEYRRTSNSSRKHVQDQSRRHPLQFLLQQKRDRDQNQLFLDGGQL